MSYSPSFSQSVEIILYIAIKSEAEQYKYLSIQTIAEKLAIPVPSLKRLVALLKNQGLITSKTGVSGGLMLSKDVEDISLFDIFQAVEGSKKPLFNFYQGFDVTAFEHAHQVEQQLHRLGETLSEAEEAMLFVLKSKTVKDIMNSK
ncbi:RrF2 family transcriptional regulator [Streptococcus dentiloxodontae]